MDKPSEIVKWFFLFLQSESAMLMRIEFLVVVIALLYQLMSFLDLWRRRSRSSTIKYVLLILDAIADSTFLYTIGLMQNATFKKDLFPVWALVLSNLRFSGCFISAYGIPDQENRRISELSNVMALLGVAFLNGTRNSQFRHPIWALWVMQVVRSCYLIGAYYFAVRSSLHGRSSMFVVSSVDRSDKPTGRSDESSEVNLKKYRYPVCGDQYKSLKVKAPGYNFDLNTTDDKKAVSTQHTRRPRSFFSNFRKQWIDKAPITLDKILSPGALDKMMTGNDIKLIQDMCLSFSLYRLLRCKFDDLPLSGDIVEKTKILVLREIMNEKVDRERTWRIVESELAFLNDYFYTRYPVLFFHGFPGLACLHPVLTIAFTFWLGRDIHKVYRPQVGEVAHVIGGVNVDLVITWVFMGVVVVKELWKTLTYVLSDWTKVMVLCDYVAERMIWVPECIRDKLVWLLCTPRFKIVERWHGKIGQYEFLRAYVYKPWKWNIFFYMSLGMMPRRKKGIKPGKSIKLPEEVKDVILLSLRLNVKNDRPVPGEKENVNEDSLVGDKNHGLPSVATFLSKNESNPAMIQIDWNPLLHLIEQTLRQPTCSYTILVWHIATSLCEIDLAQHYNTSLTDSEMLHELKHAKANNCCCCCCSKKQPYMIKSQRLERALRANYTVANSISRYCTYLLASVPELLPDSYFVPELILKSTVREASKILEGCDNLQSIYRRLMREAEDRKDNNNKDDNDQTEDDEQECKCSDLPGISCFLSFIKGVYRCFFPGKKGTQDERQPSTGGDGGNGSMNGQIGNPDTANTVDEGEHNGQRGGNGSWNVRNGSPHTAINVDREHHNDQSGGNESRNGENGNHNTDGGQYNAQNGENGSKNRENSNPHTAINMDGGVYNNQSDRNGSKNRETGNSDMYGEHNDQTGEDAGTICHDKIIKMGARLGRLLITATKDDDVARWELLAGVWADLLVHMAPSKNTEAHKRCLATGGEFITHIWAILCHCGIQKSNLWQRQEATREDQDPVQQQAKSTANQTLATGEVENDGQPRARRPRVFERGEASSSTCTQNS
uniref:DUF4220 domain-containing protein n=1 Tax=Leersia perrieri TaxID=77586 RepID=A0A0D9XK69_9ORYZ